MKNLFLAFFLCFIISSVKAQVNLISNAQFDSGKTKWFLGKFNGATATFSVDNTSQLSGLSSAKVETDNATGAKKDVKLFQDVEIASNMSYEIYFMAKTAVEREIDVSFESDLEEYWKDSLLIKPAQQHYGPLIFESDNDDLLAYFSFHLGGSSGYFFIDSIFVHEQLPTAVKENILASNPKPIFQQTTGGGLRITLPEPVAYYGDVTVSDISGKLITSKKVNPDESEINFENLNSGVYLLQLNIDQAITKEKVVLY